MNDKNIALFLMMNEPVFDIGEKQYSVCCPRGTLFCTWDSDGNTFDFPSVEDLLDYWIVEGEPFRKRADALISQYVDPAECQLIRMKAY